MLTHCTGLIEKVNNELWKESSIVFDRFLDKSFFCLNLYYLLLLEDLCCLA